MLSNLVSKTFSSTFFRAVSVLMGGTAASQAILLLALPLLTRLYSPHDFSILAVYVSAVSILSISACLRLEIALPLPLEDTEAASLLVAALVASLCVGISIAVGVLVAPNAVDDLVAGGKLKDYLWLLPAGVWLASTYSALQYWSTRKRRFSDIAKTKFTQSIGGTAVQGGLGWLGLAPGGLLFGHMVIGGAGVVGLAARALRHEGGSFRAVRVGAITAAIRRYKRFPLFSTWDALANTSGLQLPIIIIAAASVGPEAGLLMLAMRAMQAPMALIGSSVGQVFLSEAPEKVRRGELASYSAGIMLLMARLGAGPLVFAGVVSPLLFKYVFGPQWSASGDMVPWMVPWFILQFVASPVSMVMHVLQLQSEMLALTIVGLIFRVGAVILAAHLHGGLVEAFAISSALYYAVLLAIIVRRAGCDAGQVATIVKNAGFSAIGGGMAGGIFLAVVKFWGW